MATSPARSRSLYRSLLRELPARPLLASPRSSLHAHLRASFASTNSSSNGATHGRAEAEQAVAYLRSQRQYATLVERYNPGMDMEEEERVRLTARRVGMNLPIGYKPEGKQ
ncbi:Ras guanyl-nucleotide exchange factor RasGEF [Tolypocladium capitatum]|uniref:Ras guanyl-nucleotide exchange factor RasGEF n=1 Tax=Tolypocladium capitatum TaxID=45235 RepID=A0A2K3QJB4_9HYPO|nr:Ras guanyl-nucleotide exchange factor RasGEF [Tolypocladium capitatum]